MSARIALISEHASPLATLGGVDSGGQNVYVAQTARHLAAMGFHVDVFTRRDDEDMPAIVEWAPRLRVFNVRAGPPTFVRKEGLLPFMPQFAQAIATIARNARDAGAGYALCHAHFFMSGLVARRLREELGIPYVVTFHALGKVRVLHQPYDEFPRQRHEIEQLVIDAASAVIAECPQDELDLRKHYRTPQGRIRMIPCGFDPAELLPVERTAARARIGAPASRPLILQLGRMVPRKGVETVIRALPLVKARLATPPLLMIVGGESEDADPVRTPEIGRLMQVARDVGVADDVVFTGRRPRTELRNYYHAADVFVTTPWYEPFGITPVEAMACGLPVIGSRVGGIQYSVEDGRTGFLVEPRDHDALARRLAQVFSDPSVRDMLGRRARRRAFELFTWQGVSESLAELYAGVALPRPVRVRRAAVRQTAQQGT